MLLQQNCRERGSTEQPQSYKQRSNVSIIPVLWVLPCSLGAVMFCGEGTGEDIAFSFFHCHKDEDVLGWEEAAWPRSREPEALQH